MGKNDDAFFVSSSSSQDKFLPYFYLHFLYRFYMKCHFPVNIIHMFHLSDFTYCADICRDCNKCECLKGQLTLCLKWKQKIIVISVIA
jgi:hypothetical protein